MLVDMYVLRANHVMAYPNLFNYLKQELVKNPCYSMFIIIVSMNMVMKDGRGWLQWKGILNGGN
jgi:hypothetical protein